ncbi:ArsR/SmtB family transcription factor [Longispora urticae]
MRCCRHDPATAQRRYLTGAGTGELATRVGISPASASQHAAVLRAAGLLSTARVGKSVRHTVTGAGAALLGT